MNIFEQKAVSLNDSLHVYFLWLSSAIVDVEQDWARGVLDSVGQVREALDKAFGTHSTRVRELGIVMGLEHEFVRYAGSQHRFTELMAKAGDLVRKTVEREQRRATASIEAQAGNWLHR